MIKSVKGTINMVMMAMEMHLKQMNGWKPIIFTVQRTLK